MRRTLPLSRWDDLSPAHGLTTAAAGARLQTYGPNDIVEVAGNPWWDLARDTARDPMIWFLLGTGALYAALGRSHRGRRRCWSAIVPLVGMDASSTGARRPRPRGCAAGSPRAPRSCATACDARSPPARSCPATSPIVAAGEPFPADGLVVAGSELQVDESALTGEAYPVRKRPLRRRRAGSEPRPASTPSTGASPGRGCSPATRRCASSFTGGETLYGEIVRSATRGSATRARRCKRAIASLVTVLVVGAAVAVPHPRGASGCGRGTAGSTRC